MNLPKIKLAIIGLGYVGLPLAVEFGKQRPVVGFDINQKRIDELKAGHDSTLETEPEELNAASHLNFSTKMDDLRSCNCFIVTVPTPIDEHKRPDLTPLIKASETVGKVLKSGDIVIYESTVYPGCTEEDCVPVLEKFSGLKFNQDFFCGYSPERINPGDKEHRITTIKKVTSGSTPEIADLVDALYNQIIIAGTHKAPSIKVAEAAKVIENTQRDLNIALINELALIFNKMDIDTEAVLHAAGSKWNFLPFRPGLVGGHCIGVDPYYLTHKAESIGYHPQIILAGRRLNDSMGGFSDDVRVQIATADCVVLPSYREGIPRSLLEAAAMARPIITTDVVGCREVVDHGVNGYLCKVRDSGDLAEKMVSLLSLSPEQRSEMGQRGRAKIEVEFDEKIVISKYFSALEEIRVRRQV